MTTEYLKRDRSIVHGNKSFAIDLYNHLAGQDEGNLFFSPHGISISMAMAFAGARGTTEQEMAYVLRYPTDRDHLHHYFSRLRKQMAMAGQQGYQLSVANRLCGKAGFHFSPDFLELIRTHYDATLEQLDFARQPKECSQKINQWVESETRGKITQVVSPNQFNEFTRLVLMNAVYFKGEWTTPFREEQTQEASFHVNHSVTAKVQLMHERSEFGYAERADAQLLDMPYGDGDLSMVVLLPKQRGDLRAIESVLTASIVDDWLDAASPQLVDVFLPKFRLDHKLELSYVLKSMGMESAFSDGADFSGMVEPDPGLAISRFNHKAMVEVSEQGTVAAAVTTDSFDCILCPPEKPRVFTFRADHPFIFMIRHRTTGSILFLGRMVSPNYEA